MTIPLDIPTWLYKELEKQAEVSNVRVQKLIKDILKDNINSNQHRKV